MRRWLAVWLAVVFLLLAPACTRGKKIVIAVIPKGRALLYWQSVHAGAAEAARAAGVEILWNGPPAETDYAQQIQIVDSMINRRVDAIALAPIERTSLKQAVERAADQKIPVVIVDSPIDTDRFVSQVATDNYAAGCLGAERIAQILGGQGKVAMVAVQPGAGSTMAREQGFEDTIKKKYPGVEIADKRYGMADFAKSLAVAENMLTAHPDLKAMFASNETSAVGAAQALKARQSKVKLVGFDWGPTLEEGLKSGVIDSVLVQDPFRMGYEAVMAAVKSLRGQPVDKIHNLAVRLITLEGLKDPGVQKLLNPELKF